MAELTTKERFLRMYQHQDADRVPIIDVPWNGTVARWRREGMPADIDWTEYFGIDSLNPLEVKAGMDPIAIKKKYGDRLVLHGGINAVLWDDKEAITEEIRRVVPILKENGGYVFSSDHSIPNTVSLENFRVIVQEVKRVGSY